MTGVVDGAFGTEDDLPLALFSKGDLDGTLWYWQIDVECLTPNARTAMVTKVEDAGANVFSLEIMPWKFPEDGKVDWSQECISSQLLYRAMITQPDNPAQLRPLSYRLS